MQSVQRQSGHRGKPVFPQRRRFPSSRCWCARCHTNKPMSQNCKNCTRTAQRLRVHSVYIRPARPRLVRTRPLGPTQKAPQTRGFGNEP